MQKSATSDPGLAQSNSLRLGSWTGGFPEPKRLKERCDQQGSEWHFKVVVVVFVVVVVVVVVVVAVVVAAVAAVVVG